MKKLMSWFLLFALVVSGSALADDYERSIEEWHSDFQERLRSPEGYLTLSGLYWLRDEIVRIPDFGRFKREQDKVLVWVDCEHEDECTVCLRTELSLELPENSQKLRRATKLAYAIQRGDWVGIRVKDSQAATRTKFKGVERFPIRPEWRIPARLEASPEVVGVGSIVGVTTNEQSPGSAIFEHEGVTYRARLIGKPEDKEFFMVFSDRTAGKTTYPACRFLYVDRTPDGGLVLDFNKAINPMCAYTAFASCPLPQEQNIFPFPIEAGERAPAP